MLDKEGLGSQGALRQTRLGTRLKPSLLAVVTMGPAEGGQFWGTGKELGRLGTGAAILTAHAQADGGHPQQ